MGSNDNLKAAIVNGMIAVSGVLHAVSLRSDEEVDSAARNVKRQAHLAAHYAIAHLNQGGQALLPMSQAARELFIGLLRARIYNNPRPLKSIAGGSSARTRIGGELDDALGMIVRGASRLRDLIDEPTLRLELADALENIARGARLSRDCLRKNKLFFATGGRNAAVSRRRR
jgi:hypothetical protein